MGTSDRAAMIDLLLVAKGGHEVLPFNQAMFDGILRAANCTTVACLRDAPQEVLFKANSFLINEVGDGSTGALGPLTGFTPVVDGKYIEDLPTALLARGSYNRKMHSLRLFERPYLTPMTTLSNASSRCMSIPQTSLKKFHGTGRPICHFACNAYFNAKAYKNKAQGYAMTIPPATHGLDQTYFLFNSNASTPATDIAAAREFQEYVRRFVTFERNQEDYRGLDDWPNGPGETSFEIVLGSFEVQKGLLGCQPPLSSLE
ncbi:carboxylesterase [Blastomyces dermatitidis ER-3]|uniref:Carboxylesterase n=1 Tax=Ajellomyces dermatitidis (strain ER-3 / ATCC MYA-2586) TaxID=559297 RepID=A0ABP2F374_AJEDR|nr:carboxylesterase [Blastomyces dermatitidis ER-3]EEQ91331.2 carboxylesterase [Blastomyces dermatitidis ER-3]